MAKEEKIYRPKENETDKQAEDKVKDKGSGQDNKHYRDSSGKLIFGDPTLCAQFLRNYVDIPLLKDVEPEDIEDVSERYIHMFTEERDSDVVKKVNLKNNPFFLVSLIEHKSDVDYNVIMQVFRYIAFIWEDYEKEQERIHSGISKTKDFKYPPILPVIFYDGADSWTAATSLHERVLFSDVLGRYIPDYHCFLIQLKDYSNAELMEKQDELSVLMLIDKLKNAADYTELQNDISEDFLETLFKKSPEYLLKLMSEIIETFLSKLKIPQEEVDLFIDNIKGRNVGELFKQFKGWDVQALRKDVEDARKDADDARKEADDARKKADDAEKKIIETRESDIRKLLNTIKKFHATRNDAVAQLIEEYQLSADDAEKKVNLYW